MFAGLHVIPSLTVTDLFSINTQRMSVFKMWWGLWYLRFIPHTMIINYVLG
jgi:hypothetical protein